MNRELKGGSQDTREEEVFQRDTALSHEKSLYQANPKYSIIYELWSENQIKTAKKMERHFGHFLATDILIANCLLYLSWAAAAGGESSSSFGKEGATIAVASRLMHCCIRCESKSRKTNIEDINNWTVR